MQTKSDDLWRGLSLGDGLRVNKDGKYDFFWAVLENASPAIVLFLPELPQDSGRLPRLRNLEAGFRVLSRPAFYLKLTDSVQRELFHVLCKDVVEFAEGAETLADALERTIKRTRRWHFLLKGGNLGGLSVDEQRGLIGELAFLRELSGKIGPLAAIEAWLGPEGAAKDFELPHCCVEVKSRRSAAKPNISISSVDQLTDVDGAVLYLRVYHVDSHANDSGDNLHVHVDQTAKLFEDHEGSFDIWQDRIYATGYAPEGDYDELKWVVGMARSFDIVDGFPRLIPPLPEGIENLTYSISLATCDPFDVENESVLRAAKGNEHG